MARVSGPGPGPGGGRRRVLALGAVATVLAAGGGVLAARRWARRSPAPGARAALGRQLRARFRYLRCEEAVFERFLDDFEAHFPALVRHAGSSRVDVFGRFLLSTDFFAHGDPARPLRYVTFYHPYVTPCYNPLAAPR
jgi:hypothetical protein